jgi:hypothetical protein
MYLFFVTSSGTSLNIVASHTATANLCLLNTKTVKTVLNTGLQKPMVKTMGFYKIALTAHGFNRGFKNERNRKWF